MYKLMQYIISLTHTYIPWEEHTRTSSNSNTMMTEWAPLRSALPRGGLRGRLSVLDDVFTMPVPVKMG